jgi:hypothetical protein
MSKKSRSNRAKKSKTLVRGVRTGGPGERHLAIANLVAMVKGRQPATGALILSASRRAPTNQVDGPISFSEGPHGVVGLVEGGVETRFLLESGEIVSGKTASADRPSPNLKEMKDATPKKRAPMVRNRRPGKGGRQLAPPRGTDIKELEKYGEIEWRAASQQAVLGLIQGDPEGDTVILCRVSGDERGDTLEGQLEPTFAYCKGADLKVRLVILAEAMSGARHVVGDRELPPTPDMAIRDDIRLLDSIVEAEGWPEHVVLRGSDRIARDVLYMEMILRRWMRYGLKLHLAQQGGLKDYEADRLGLTAMNMVSAEERMSIVKRTQSGAKRKGPQAGKGWLGSTRFGFVRDENKDLKPDPVQWPFILRAFELADVGLDGKALSTREIAGTLAEEGCTFDHDRVRTILKDPIYTTGEFTVNVEGVPLGQKPVPLTEPVPIDRFQRVQDKMKTRKGASSLTPYGEFALNGVELVHKACEGERREKDGAPSRIRGYVKSSNQTTRRYSHQPFVPDGCQRLTWERDEIEQPVVEFLREIVEDPEIVAALANATRPDIAGTSTRLTEEQRQSLETQIDQLERRKAEMADEMIVKSIETDEMAGSYAELISACDRKIEEFRRRLDRDAAAARRDEPTESEKLKNSLLDILSVETPKDEDARALRAHAISQAISKVVIDDSKANELSLTIYGPLVPEGGTGSGIDPVSRNAELLTESQKSKLQTDLSSEADKSVCSFRNRIEKDERQGLPAWSKTIVKSQTPI